MRKETLSDEILISDSRSAYVIIVETIKKPVAKMKPCIPKIILTSLLHISNPCLHAVILILQDSLITISQVHIPWNDGARIGPAGRANRLSKYVRYNKRDGTIGRLVRRKIF